MKGDFSRDTFDPANHFSRVLMQQGRVQLDADWNEQTSILLHYLRTLAADVIGSHAGPDAGMGFDLITKNRFKNLEDKDRTAQWEQVEPDPDRREVLRKMVEYGADAVIGAGRYYVDGILVENHNPMLYTEQPGYPFYPGTELDDTKDKELIFYLDVWERNITYVQDNRVREVALGGADTCTRAQVIWQVKPLFPKDEGDFNCASIGVLLARKYLPLLRVRAQRGSPSPELCSVSPESKYRGLENHLYRVEVHAIDVQSEPKIQGKGKKAGTIATFKWSRDNGCVVCPIVSLHETTALVASLGRDQCSHLEPGDWVEVCDDVLCLSGQSGPLAKVERVDRDELKVTLKWPDGITDLPSYTEGEMPANHPLLRRWDHDGDLASYDGALPVVESADPDNGWIALEDGLEIWFAEAKEYQVGDYWLIPARVATGDVEWPRKDDPDGQSLPTALPPKGPQHHYAPLLYVAKDGTENRDCRCRIRHLPREEENGG
jgi:hypothetical protein